MADEKPVKICKEDAQTVKRTLDESASLWFTSTAGYPEDNYISNLRLTIGFVSVCVALLGQFFPIPFPQNRIHLAVIVAIYFILSTIGQAVFLFVDKETFLIAKKKGNSPALSLRSTMDKASPNYNLFIGDAYPKRGSFDKVSGKYKGDFKSTVQVTSYFTESGLFLQNKFHDDLKSIAANYVASLQESKKGK